MRMLYLLGRAGIFGVLSLVALVGSSLAQLDPDRVREALERREGERLLEQKRLAEQVAPFLRAEESGSNLIEIPLESPCFVIKDIKLEGDDVPVLASLFSSVEAEIGRCLGSKGVSAIARQIDARLIKKGYVTSRVTLPAQNLSEGVLRFTIQRGVIGTIQLIDREQSSSWGTWRNAFPLSAGKLLDIRDLEQGVEQMRRLPSQSIQTKIEPGSIAGSSNIIIERVQQSFSDRLRGGVTVDTNGVNSKNRLNSAINVTLDNPTGLMIWSILV
jgi:hemolysin activation/secretion protein